MWGERRRHERCTSEKVNTQDAKESIKVWEDIEGKDLEGIFAETISEVVWSIMDSGVKGGSQVVVAGSVDGGKFRWKLKGRVSTGNKERSERRCRLWGVLIIGLWIEEMKKRQKRWKVSHRLDTSGLKEWRVIARSRSGKGIKVCLVEDHDVLEMII